MKNITDLYTPQQHPVKVLQIGEGNFLRAFVDYAIDVANEEKGFDAGVAVVMPRAKKRNERFDKQKNLYTVLLRGQKDGKPYKENRVITCINEVL
ncbi:MAG: tagaturonate reductase, partial [Selenomonadaceae bacterium]|nr:tagaturonate reductase [Selenomonadaceae bacterium]